MIIRDGDRQMDKKHFGTRLSEFFSTRIGFNQTRGDEKKLFFTSREKIMKILTEHGMEAEIVDETKMTSNLVYIARKSEVGGQQSAVGSRQSAVSGRYRK
jgi:hypothetical protein